MNFLFHSFLLWQTSNKETSHSQPIASSSSSTVIGDGESSNISPPPSSSEGGLVVGSNETIDTSTIGEKWDTPECQSEIVDELSPFVIPREASPICEKLQWLKLHPVQPILSNMPFDATRVYFRTTSITYSDAAKSSLQPKQSEMIPRKWLSYCSETKKIYCSMCAVFSTDKISIFCKGKFIKDTRHVYNDIEKHEVSEAHKTATIAFLINSKNANVQSLLFRGGEKLIQENREIVHRVINIILLLAKQNAGFRGHREEAAYNLTNLKSKQGNFLETVKFLAIYDPVIKVHIEKVAKKSEEARKKRSLNTIKKTGRGSSVTFLSKTFVRKVIIIIGDLIEKAIAKDVNADGIFSLEVDSTQDVSVQDQLSICVRYVDKNEDSEEPVQERFLKMVSIKSGSGKDLHEVIKKELGDLNIDLKNLVSESFDGAANMSGKYIGLQQQLCKTAPESIYTHCHAHVLNLVVGDLLMCSISVQNVIGLIQKTAVFLSSSYKRKNVWTDIVTKNETGSDKLRNLKKIFEVRWNSADRGLRSIFNSWSEEAESQVAPTRTQYFNLLKSLHKIGYSPDIDPDTATEARSLLKNWSLYENILTSFLLLQLFSETTPVSSYLQTKGLDYIAAWNQINHLMERMKVFSEEKNYESLKNRVATFITAVNEWLDQDESEMSENIEIETEFPQKRIRKVKKRPGEKASDDKCNWSPDQKYRVDVVRRIYDVIIMSLETRFKKNSDLIKALVYLDPNRFNDISTGKLKIEEKCLSYRG